MSTWYSIPFKFGYFLKTGQHIMVVFQPALSSEDIRFMAQCIVYIYIYHSKNNFVKITQKLCHNDAFCITSRIVLK